MTIEQENVIYAHPPQALVVLAQPLLSTISNEYAITRTVYHQILLRVNKGLTGRLTREETSMRYFLIGTYTHLRTPHRISLVLAVAPVQPVVAHLRHVRYKAPVPRKLPGTYAVRPQIPQHGRTNEN